MATKVHMEALSPTMEEGEVVRWLKAEGEEVANGDVLAEIETDKATMELVARGDGVLRKQILAEGDTAAVGTVIGVIAGADEDISDLVEDGGAEPAEAEAEPAAPSAERAPAEEAGPRAETPAPATATAPTGDGSPARSGDGRIKASPLARRLAEEEGLELRRIQGSGPGGRIIKRDIEEALAQAPAQAGVGAGPGVGPEVEEVPVSQMRKSIAKRLVQSIGPVPTFYLTVDVDMTRMVEARERINERLEGEDRKVSINDMLLKATAMALTRHPEVNAAWHEDHIKRYRRVHMGVAVAVEDGLITPVVRDAHLKGVAEIGEEVRELAGRAREKKLQPEEYTGATFSLSNLGMFGIEEFTAIINPPESGIIAVGQVEERPVVDEDGDLVVRSRMKMTMSCDHRVVDGATGSRFLQTLRSFIEEPTMMVV